MELWSFGVFFVRPGGEWLPEGAIQLSPGGMMMTTMVLSGFTVAWAVQALSADDRSHAYIALFITGIFGASIINQMWFVYTDAALTIDGGEGQFFFYVLTGAFLIMLIGAMLISCAAQKPQPIEPAFEPVDLNPKLQSGQYVQKIDTYMIILDASQSMSEEYNGRTKFSIAKNIVSRLNQTVPDIKVYSGLRTFGHGTCLPQEETLLINKVQTHSKQELEEGLAKVACDGGNSPLVPAIEAASRRRTQGVPVGFHHTR